MNISTLHAWDLNPAEARQLQEQLAQKIIREECTSSFRLVCGVDTSVVRDTAHAACVVMSLPKLQIVDYAVESTPVNFPYIPGLLSFREIPALIPALKRLSVDPDIFIVDGQGIAHPRRLGLAAHLGLLCDRPSIGCAKSKLIGEYREPGNNRGDWEYLYDGDEIIGVVLRTRSGVKPVIVSIGNRISLGSAIDYTLRCCTKYRLTEPIRYAHRVARSGSL